MVGYRALLYASLFICANCFCTSVEKLRFSSFLSYFVFYLRFLPPTYVYTPLGRRTKISTQNPLARGLCIWHNRKRNSEVHCFTLYLIFSLRKFNNTMVEKLRFSSIKIVFRFLSPFPPSDVCIRLSVGKRRFLHKIP